MDEKRFIYLLVAEIQRQGLALMMAQWPEHM
jgi:hypothetical protein